VRRRRPLDAKQWAKRRRRLARAGDGGGYQNPNQAVSRISLPGIHIDEVGISKRSVKVSNQRGITHDPARSIAESIRDALDPVKQPSKVKTLADMTAAERAEMQRMYGGGPKK